MLSGIHAKPISQFLTDFQNNVQVPGIIPKVAQATFFILKSSYSGLSLTVSFTASWLGKYFYKPSNEPLKKIHDRQCEEIEKKFNAIIKRNHPIVLEPKLTTNLYRPRNLSSCRIDLRHLNQVISIDTDKGIANVQSMISFYDLLEETFKKGFRPKVVPELRGITLGGAISGLAVESSSFKHGLVHHSVLEMEVLTGSGSIVTCSPTLNKDLFYGIPNSYGTLGYILSAKIQLEPAMPYVDVSYLHFKDCTEYFNKIKELCQNTEDYDFIDGAIFSADNMVIVTGKAVDKPSHAPAADYVKEEIYYKAIQVKNKESFKLNDYIWRWDRDLFWSTSNSFFQAPWFRKSMGPIFLRSDRLNRINRFIKAFMANVIHPFNRPKIQKEELIQDVGMPIDKCAEFYEWFKKEIGLHPLFICPVQPETLSTPLWKMPMADQLYCDVGFFSRKFTTFEPGHYNRVVEDKLPTIGGKKSLYSRSYYPEKQFKELYYGDGAYEELKKRFDPQNCLPTLFDKCVKGR